MATNQQARYFSYRYILYIFFLVIFFAIPRAASKYVEGVIKTDENWAFITRFCFRSSYGNISYFFNFSPLKGSLPSYKLLFYYDRDVWSSVYKNSTMSCKNKEKTLSYSDGHIILLSNRTYDCVTVNNKVVCENTRRFTSSHALWWYIAVSNCDGKGIDLSYKIWMRNNKAGTFWEEHFSADQLYTIHADIGFLILYVIIVSLIIYVSVELYNLQLFHSTYKIYLISVILELLYFVIQIAFNATFGQSGVENVTTKYLAKALNASSDIVFLLLLILVAKGFTVTRGRLSNKSTALIVIYFSVYTIMYAIIFIFEAHVFDPGEVLYTYESPPGYALIALKLLSWFWFCYALFFTFKHYPEKSNFYCPFFVCYTLWFWMMPALTLIMTKYVSDWQRERIAAGVTSAMNIAAHAYFLVLTWPSQASTNFPYHVRTSQIANFSPDTHNNGTRQGTNGSFPQNVYEMSSKNTEDMYMGRYRPDVQSMFSVGVTQQAPS